MVRDFPLAPLEKIAREAGAERVAVSASHHAGRVTVKASDIKIACR